MPLPPGWGEVCLRVWAYDDAITCLHVPRCALFDHDGARNRFIFQSGLAVYGTVAVTEAAATIVDYQFNDQDRSSTVKMTAFCR